MYLTRTTSRYYWPPLIVRHSSDSSLNADCLETMIVGADDDGGDDYDDIAADVDHVNCLQRD